MDGNNNMIINFIDMALVTFLQEPTTAKIQGKFEKEIAAKYYLMGKGLSAEDVETYIDKISNKLESLSDKQKNAVPTPASMESKSSDYSSYQGPGEEFTHILVWIKLRDNCETATCSFHDDEEHMISQTMITCLESPVRDGFALLRWCPENSSTFYRTSFRVVPTKLAISDILLGKQWWEDHKEEVKGDFKDAKKSKDRSNSDAQSVISSTSTNKSRHSNGNRKPSITREASALKKVGKALFEVMLEQEGSGSDAEEDG